MGYNITDLEDKLQQVKFEPWDKFFAGVERMIEVQSIMSMKGQR